MSSELRANSSREEHADFSFSKKDLTKPKPITMKGNGEFVKKIDTSATPLYAELEKTHNFQNDQIKYCVKRGIDASVFASLKDQIDTDMITLKENIDHMQGMLDTEGVIAYREKRIRESQKLLAKELSVANIRVAKEGLTERKENYVSTLNNIIAKTLETIKQPYYEKGLEEAKNEYKRALERLQGSFPSLARGFSQNLEDVKEIQTVLEIKREKDKKEASAWIEKKNAMKQELQDIVDQTIIALGQPNHRKEIDRLQNLYTKRFGELRKLYPALIKNFELNLMDNSGIESAVEFIDDDEIEEVGQPPDLDKQIKEEERISALKVSQIKNESNTSRTEVIEKQKPSNGFFSRWGKKIGGALLAIGAVIGLSSTVQKESHENYNSSDLKISTKGPSQGAPESGRNVRNTNLQEINFDESDGTTIDVERPNIQPKIQEVNFDESEGTVYVEPNIQPNTTVAEVARPVRKTIARKPESKPQSFVSEGSTKKPSYLSGVNFKEPKLSMVETGFSSAHQVDLAVEKLRETNPRMNVIKLKNTINDAISNTIEGAPTFQKREQVEALLADALREKNPNTLIKSVVRVLENYNFNNMNIGSLKNKIESALQSNETSVGAGAGDFLKTIRELQPTISEEMLNKYKDAFERSSPKAKNQIKTLLDVIDLQEDPRIISKKMQEAFRLAFKK